MLEMQMQACPKEYDLCGDYIVTPKSSGEAIVLKPNSAKALEMEDSTVCTYLINFPG